MSLGVYIGTRTTQLTPCHPSKTQQGDKKQLIPNTNGQNTRDKRRSPLAKLRLCSQGSSLSSSGFNVDTEPREEKA